MRRKFAVSRSSWHGTGACSGPAQRGGDARRPAPARVRVGGRHLAAALDGLGRGRPRRARDVEGDGQRRRPSWTARSAGGDRASSAGLRTSAGVDRPPGDEARDEAAVVGQERARPRARRPAACAALVAATLGRRGRCRALGVLAADAHDVVAAAEAAREVAVRDARRSSGVRLALARAERRLEALPCELPRTGRPLARKARPYTVHGAMTLDELEADVASGQVDTVLLAMTDMQGRLQGKRLTARALPRRGRRPRRRGVQLPARGRRRDEHRSRATRSRRGSRATATSCSSPTSRRCAACPGTRPPPSCLADVRWHDGGPSPPRRGRSCAASSSAWPSAAGAPRRRPSSSSCSSAHLRGGLAARATATSSRPTSTTSTTRCWGPRSVEPLIRRIRNAMAGAGLGVENSKGECNLGQHEINFRYADALTAADEHVIYKTGAKEIADQEGMAITFMAKFDEREGNSCHIHLSLPARGRLGALRARTRAPSRPSWPACWRRCAELTLLLAPEHQLLQALRGRLVRPDDDRLGPRQPHLRAARRRPRAGHAPGVPRPGRRRQPLPRAQRAHRGRPARGRRRARARAAARGQRLRRGQAARARRRCATRATASRAARSSRAALGEEVVAHYLHAARVELDAFDAAVTDWERVRGFERL